MELRPLTKELISIICEEMKFSDIDINTISRSTAIDILEKIKNVINIDDKVMDECEKVDHILYIMYTDRLR